MTRWGEPLWPLKSKSVPVRTRNKSRTVTRTHDEPETPRGRDAYVFDLETNPYPIGSLGNVIFWTISRMPWPSRVKQVDRRSIAHRATDAVLERLKNWHIAPPPPAKVEVSRSQAGEKKADSA